jgi:GDSL-like Lipase/Acylhydrolase family
MPAYPRRMDGFTGGRRCGLLVVMLAAWVLLHVASAQAAIVSSSQPGLPWVGDTGGSGTAVATDPQGAPIPGATWISPGVPVGVPEGTPVYQAYTLTFTVSPLQAMVPAEMTFAAAGGFGVGLNGKTLYADDFGKPAISFHLDLRPGANTLVIGSSAPVVWIVDTSSYVALGDAYAAGEGNPQYVVGTIAGEGGLTGCHRSQKAWGYLVAEALKPGHPNVQACSGSTTGDYFAAHSIKGGRGFPSEKEAAQQSYVTTDAELVTISMGGDDVKFANLTTQCAHGIAPTIKDGFGRTLPHIRNCTHNRALRKTIATSEGKLSTELVRMYSDIAARMAPGGHLIVVGYPTLWPARPPATCSFGNQYTRAPVYADRSTQSWMNAQVVQLNAVVSGAAAKAVRPANGVTIDYVDVISAFGDHGFCGRFHRPWFNAIRFSPTAGLKVSVQSPADLKPNGCGERAYAFAVTTFLHDRYNLAKKPSRPCSDTQAIVK